MANRVLRQATEANPGYTMHRMAWQMHEWFEASPNWTIIDQVGDWTSYATVDLIGFRGSYFVLRCNTAWGDGRTPELIIAVNGTGSAATFGGLGGTDYTTTTSTFSFVFSPDGGWDVATKAFIVPGTLPQEHLKTVTSGGTGLNWNFCLADCPQAIIWWAGGAFPAVPTWATYTHGAYIGKLDTCDPATDLKPVAFFVGNPADRSISAGAWGYPNLLSLSRVPNAAWTGWEACCIVAPAVYDGWGQGKTSAAWVQRPLEVRDVATSRSCGSFTYLRLADTALTDGDISADFLWCHLFGIDWPWQA